MIVSEYAKLSAVHLNSLWKARAGSGVGVGGDVTVNGTDAVDVRGGVCLSRGRLRPIINLTALSTGTRHATLPKRNLVIYDYSADDVVVLQGTAAATPEPPALSDNSDVVLAIVYVPASGGAAVTVTDVRGFVDWAAWGWMEEFAVVDTTNLWTKVFVGATGTVAVNTDTNCVVQTVSGVLGDCACLKSKGGLKFDFGQALWLRARLRQYTYDFANGLKFGLWYDDGGTPLYDALDASVCISFMTSGPNFSLRLANGTAESGTALYALPDLYWHNFDLIITKDTSSTWQAMVWLNGVYKGRLAASMPTGDGVIAVMASNNNGKLGIESIMVLAQTE